MSDSPLDRSVDALSRFFVGDSTVSETLHRVSELTLDAVPVAALVGLTMIVDGRQRTAVFTDETAPEIDQAQYDTGEGPCIEAFEQAGVRMIESTLEDGPWPAFRRAAADHGILSTLSLPMMVNGDAVGAMNLYARTERAFTGADADVDAAQRFAAQAAIVVANAQAYWEMHDLSARLTDAMQSRATIEQAKGILMATQPCDAEQAFQLLVRASQRENTKLRDVAARIVASAVDRATAER